MKCLLCNKTEQCSCRGGGCPNCKSKGAQIKFVNDLIGFGLQKDIINERLTEIRSYVNKIDSYTMYEFLSGEIDKTKLDEAISEYKPQTTVENRNYSEYKKVEEFVPKTNPEEFCVFNSSSPRDRCVFCNSIQKYVRGKQCLRFKNAEKTEEIEKS